MKEQHLFILWEKARHKEFEIITDIKTQFKILKEYEIHWDKDKFRLNLGSFYSEDFEFDTYQEEIRGNGAFLVILVEDENPIYENNINQNTFKFKHKWRKELGSFTIHGTDNLKQLKHDICLLTSKSLSDILQTEILDGSRQKIYQNLPCVDGWKSLEHIFYILNETVNYVILRNFELLPNEYKIDEHGDIDILVEDAPTFIAIVQKHNNLLNNSFNFRNTVEYADTSVLFHTKILGDNYYDYNFEKRLINTAIKNDKGIRIPNSEEYFYSLLYHVLYHKNSISNTYIPILTKYAKYNNIEFKNNWKYLAKILNDYMKKNNFKYHLIFMEDDFIIPRKKVYDKSLINKEPDLLYYSCGDLGSLVVNKLLILKNKNLVTRLISYYNRVCHLEGHYLDKKERLYKIHAPKADKNELAWFYKRRFGKVAKTTFYLKNGEIWVKRKLLNKTGYCGNDFIHWIQEKPRRYINGINFYSILQKNRANKDDFKNMLEVYIAEIFNQFAAPDNLLKSEIWDCYTTNCIVDYENKYNFFDFEYTNNKNIDKTYALYRILCSATVGNDFLEYWNYFIKKFNLEDKLNWCEYYETQCIKDILVHPKEQKNNVMFNNFAKFITVFIPVKKFRKKIRKKILNSYYEKDIKLFRRYFR